MSERFNQLSVKHRALIEHCAVQRAHLGEAAQDIEVRLGRVDRAVAVVRRVIRNPLFIVGGIAVIALVGPKRLLGLASRAAVAYPTVRRVAGMVRDIRNPE
jgi:YqjK-like protein